MPKHRYYIVLEDGEVHWSDDSEHAKIFSEDGTSIVIDVELNVTLLDGEASFIEDIVPDEIEPEDDEDSDD